MSHGILEGFELVNLRIKFCPDLIMTLRFWIASQRVHRFDWGGVDLPFKYEVVVVESQGL